MSNFFTVFDASNNQIGFSFKDISASSRTFVTVVLVVGSIIGVLLSAFFIVRYVRKRSARLRAQLEGAENNNVALLI